MAAPSAPQSAGERAAFVAERKRRSFFWRLIGWGSSLHMAMILLIVLAVACAVATVAESKLNADVARHYIYKAPWFLVWLLALVANLTCVIVSRWPWQKKHASFIVAHIGIIILLTGAVVGQRWGFEGFVDLAKGRSESAVVLQQEIVDVRLPDLNLYEKHPLPLAFRPPTEAHPLLLRVPHTGLRLKIDRRSDALSEVETLVPDDDPASGAGVALHVANPGMGQSYSLVVLEKDAARRTRDFFGLATIGWDDESVPPGTAPALRVWKARADGSVPFRSFAGGKLAVQGLLRPGVAAKLGWSGWEATLDGALPKATVSATLAENGDGIGGAIPGIRLAVLDGGQVLAGPDWLASGGAETFSTPRGPLRVAFGLKVMPLPFAVTLLKFEVPRDEGTDNPADFIATVRFDDPEGHSRTGEAHMNYPASFPGGFWSSVFGRNYKFSQSSWDPNDLDRTTLQVLFDPGWPLKWFGSILIVLGVALLFYYKPERRTPTST